jgi:hypothetical protein
MEAGGVNESLPDLAPSLQVQVSAGASSLTVRHLELSGDRWTAACTQSIHETSLLLPPGRPPPPPVQVQVSAGDPSVSVQHLELSGDSWTAEVDGRRLKGTALLFTHAGEQVLTVWQDGKSYEFRCAKATAGVLAGRRGSTLLTPFSGGQGGGKLLVVCSASRTVLHMRTAGVLGGGA